MHVQVFGIFQTRLQQLQVSAAALCETLAWLLLLWTDGSVAIANPLLASGKSAELGVCVAVWFVPFPCYSGGRLSVTSLFLCSSIIYP